MEQAVMSNTEFQAEFLSYTRQIIKNLRIIKNLAEDINKEAQLDNESPAILSHTKY